VGLPRGEAQKPTLVGFSQSKAEKFFRKNRAAGGKTGRRGRRFLYSAWGRRRIRKDAKTSRLVILRFCAAGVMNGSRQKNAAAAGGKSRRAERGTPP